MSDKQHSENSSETKKNIGIRLVVSLAILIIAALLLWLIFSTEPKAVRVGATKKTAMLVEVIEVNKGAFRPTLEAMGVVQPSKDIVLRPQVAGNITKISPSFVPGGFVTKGEILLQIETSDYRNLLAQKKASLEQAKAEFRIESGQQDAARESYELLEESLPEEKEALVLRKPQLKALKAKIEAAQAAVSKAERDLWRTTIKAPFDAHILTRNVNVGSQVSAGSALGRLVGWRRYWVETSVPVGKLRWLDFPDENGNEGAKVRIRNRSGWPENTYREGRLFKLIGALEEKTRLARVLVTIDDPLSHLTENKEKQALMIGSFVDVRIEGHEIKNVVRIKLDYLRKNETVWVMQEGALDIRKAEVLLQDVEYAYLSKGLKDKEKIVTTNLANVVQGAALRLKQSKKK